MILAPAARGSNKMGFTQHLREKYAQFSMKDSLILNLDVSFGSGQLFPSA